MTDSVITNVINKNPLRADIRFGLVYPNVYKTAMSSLGYQILYNYIKDGMSYFINGFNKFNSLKKLEAPCLSICEGDFLYNNNSLTELSLFTKLMIRISISTFDNIIIFREVLLC